MRVWRGIVVGVTVGVALVVVVPGAGACQLPDVTGCTPPPPPEPPAPQPPAPAPELPIQPPAIVRPDTEAAEARLLVLINDDRRAQGLREVVTRVDVEEIADDHSAAMAAARDIWHNDAYFSSATKRRLGAARVGENVALNRDPDDAHRKLMASPLHRANILDPGFSVIGIAASADDEGRLYITEDFLDPISVAPPISPKHAAAAPPAPLTQGAVPAPAELAPTQPPAVEEEMRWDGSSFELALGPLESLPKREDSSRPWLAYVVATGLLASVAVGLRRVAC